MRRNVASIHRKMSAHGATPPRSKLRTPQRAASRGTPVGCSSSPSPPYRSRSSAASSPLSGTVPLSSRLSGGRRASAVGAKNSGIERGSKASSLKAERTKAKADAPTAQTQGVVACDVLSVHHSPLPFRSGETTDTSNLLPGDVAHSLKAVESPKPSVARQLVLNSPGKVSDGVAAAVALDSNPWQCINLALCGLQAILRDMWRDTLRSRKSGIHLGVPAAPPPHGSGTDAPKR